MTPPKDITGGEWESEFAMVLCKKDRLRHVITVCDGHLGDNNEANARMMAASKALAEALAELWELNKIPMALHAKVCQALLKSGYTP